MNTKVEEKFTHYSKSNLTEFRKSIQAMGTPVNNGTIEIPQGTILTNGHRLNLPIKPELILKTPLSDIKA